MGRVGRVIAGALLIVGGIALGATGNWNLAFVAFGFGANLLYQPGKMDLSDRQGRVLNNRASAREYLPVVYGTTQIGGALVDLRTHLGSENNKRLVVVVCFCHGSQDGTGIEAIDELWLDERLAISGDSSAAVQDPFNTPVDGQGVDHLEYGYHLGTDPQATDPQLTTYFPASWPSGAGGAGVAYARLDMWFNQDIYPGGLPRFQAKIRGNKVWDPRDSTWKWSTNPSLCIRDYLTSPVYGLGLDEANLDEQSFIDAANYCDELVDDPDGGSSGAQMPRFELNGWVDTSRTIEQNLVELCSSCRGQIVNEGDQWRLVIRRQRSVSGFKINVDNTLEGSWSFALPGSTGAPNVVRAVYIDPDKKYEPETVQWPPAGESNIYLSQDNGYENRLEMDLPYTDNRGRAEQIAMTTLKEQRESITVACVLREEAMQIHIGDLVEVTHPTPGWTDKVFDVTALLLQTDGTVRALLVEYESTVYDYDAQLPGPGVGNTGFPDPFFVDPIPSGTLVLTTGTRRPFIRVTWDASPASFIDHYEIQARLDSEAEFRNWPDMPADVREAWIGPVLPDEEWVVRVRAVNVIGVKSEWVDEFHMVVINGPGEFTVVVTGEDDAINYDVTFADDCQYVYVYSKQNGPSAGGGLPPESTEYLAGILENGITSSIRIGTTYAYYRATKMVGWTWDGLRGEVETFETQAVASGAGPTSPPSGLSQASATSSTIIASWTNGDATAQTGVWADGVFKGYAAAAATTFEITGLLPTTDYDVEIAHYKNGVWNPVQPGRVGPVVMSTTSLPQLDAPTAFLAYGANCDKGDPMAAFQWTMGANAGPAGAKTRVQRSATGAWAGEEVDVVLTSGGATSANTYTPTSGSFTHRARHERLGWSNSNWTYYSAFATYGDCEPL